MVCNLVESGPLWNSLFELVNDDTKVRTVHKIIEKRVENNSLGRPSVGPVPGS